MKILILMKKQEKNIRFMNAKKEMIHHLTVSARILRNTNRKNILKKIQSVINVSILRLALARAMLLIVKQSLTQEAITYVAELGVLKMNNCNLTNCRYNADGKCTNDEKRKECVRVSKAVLMIDDLVDIEVSDNQRIKKKNPFNVCDTNPNCEYDPETCGFAVEYSSFEDVSKGIHKYMCGRYKCKYQK